VAARSLKLARFFFFGATFFFFFGCKPSLAEPRLSAQPARDGYFFFLGQRFF
jgi:hypothetical protein